MDSPNSDLTNLPPHNTVLTPPSPTQPHPTTSYSHPTTCPSSPHTRPHIHTPHFHPASLPSRADTLTYGPSHTTLSQRVSTPTAVEMVDVVNTSTINHLKTDQHALGGGGQPSSARVNDEGRRPRRIQCFEFCRLFFSLREVTLTEGIT